MATTGLVDQDRGVRVGRVFDRAFSTIRHHPLATLTVALLFTGIPGTAADFLVRRLLPWQYMVMTVGPLPVPGTFALGIVIWFISSLFGAIAQGAMTRPVIAENEGRRAGLGEVLSAGIRVLAPLTVLGIITGVSVIIGTSLLIFPGVMIFLLWAVAPAALATERDGVFLALSRSQELSEGARWKVLAILLVLFGATLLAGLLVGFLSAVAFRIGWIGATSADIFRGLVGAMVNVMWGAVQASLYVELAEWKDGRSIETLEQVFV